jgi:hypothetical protein
MMPPDIRHLLEYEPHVLLFAANEARHQRDAWLAQARAAARRARLYEQALAIKTSEAKT